MDNKMEKLRKRYPNHVPVICVNTSDKNQQQKLIVPNHTTGAGFLAIAREKCAWATHASKVLLCKGNGTDAAEVPMQKVLKELDSQYKAPDGAVYFKVEGAEIERPEDAAEGPQEFKMNEAVPQEQKAKGAAPTARKDDPAEKARRIRKKHPDRVPVLINQAEAPGLPAIDKKLLIPMNMTCGDLRKILPKHIGCQNLDVDWSKVTFQLAGDDVEEHELVSEIYTRRVEPDDEGIMLSLELASPPILEPGAETMKLSEKVEEVAAPQEVPSFSPPSAEELRVLEHQLLEVNVAFEEARKAKDIAAAKLVVEEERVWAAEEKLLKADQELSVRCQAHRNREEALQSQITEAKQVQEALETKLISGKEEIEALRLHIDWLEVTLHNSKQQAEEDSSKIAQLEHFLIEQEKSLAVEAKKNHAVQEQVSELEEKLQEVAANEAKAKKNAQMYSDLRDDAEVRILELEQSLHQMSDKLQQAEEENARLVRDADKQQKPDEAVKKLKDTVTILKDALCSKDAEIISKGAQVADTMACLKTVEAENRRLQAELQAAAKEKGKLQQDHNRALEEVDKLKAQMQKKDAEEDFIKLGWNSEGEVEEVTEDFGFQKVDSACA